MQEKRKSGKSRLLFAGLAFLAMVVLVFIVWLLEKHLFSGVSGETVESLLPRCGRILVFTLSSALAAELICLPFSLALSSTVTYLVPERLREKSEAVISGFSAIPAVVFGYMSLRFYVPQLPSPWLAVTVTLVLMGLPGQTLDFLRVNGRQSARIERARALGANRREVALLCIFPQVRNEYLLAAIRNFIRNLSEGVAVLLVLSYYDAECDTLSTALMRAVGVTGETGRLWWIVLLGLLLFLLVEIGNYALSLVTDGGRNGEKKTA